MKQRILTAVIALIILVPLIIYGNLPFVVFAYLFAFIGLYELIRMYQHGQGIVNIFISVLFLSGLLYPNETLHVFGIVFSKFDLLTMFLVILLIMTVMTKNHFTFDQAGFLFIATAYIGISFHLLIEARFLGLHYVLFILFVIWATDSGAYFVGKTFGKRKLWPDISPNKTIGGAIGGIVMALLVGVIFQFIYPFSYSWITMMLVILVISIFGQIGDLVASAIKRHYQVKDSGKLFPGHGGILDRLDSLLFVLIVLHIIQFV
jgi:phosphatidate cytidylyltransferase